MTENGSSVLSRAARVLLACGVLSLGASALWAQGTTGKVQGTVLDPTGQPIANAQVFVLGTSFAALTNEDGFYFINNVSAGTYSMRAQFIGYQPAQMDGIRILADQTLTADFRLSGAIALEAITITAAEQPIVPRDQVSSKSIVTGEDIDRLPVHSVTAMVLLQPGVVSARGGAISIRGGRANEAAIFIDGAQVRRLDTGDWAMGLNTSSLAEVSVTTGAMGAEYGDAQSGVISVVTRTGGSRLVGQFAYEGDEMMGKAMSTGYNRFEGSLSGPIFGNLTFALGGMLSGSRPAWNARGEEKIPTYVAAGYDTTVVYSAAGGDSTRFDVPRIIQYGGECDQATNYGYAGTWAGGEGYECQGRINGFGWGTNYRVNGKLQMTYGGGSRLSFSALSDMNQGWGVGAFSREGASGNRSTSNMLVMDWVQQIFRGTDNELALNLNLSYQTDRSLGSTFDRQWAVDNRDAFLGINLSPAKFITDWDRFGPGDPNGVLQHMDTLPDGGHLITQLETQDDWEALINNVRYDQGTLRSYLERTEINNRAEGARVNPWATGSYTIWGVNNGQTYLYEKRYLGRLNVDWQADRYNRFRFGAEGTTGFVGRWGMGWTAKSFGQGYSADPYKWAAFAQDRLDLGDVVIELGVRYDKFDTRAIYPLVPGRLFTNPAFDQTKTVEEMTCPYSRTECAENNLYDYVWYNSSSHDSWAPRVRVSFPVTDRTGFRLSYAHQTQSPDFNSMYRGTNNDLANTNTNDSFGGDVALGKSILFEFGIRHAFSPDMVLDISAYNKDKVSDITYRVLPFFDTFSDRISNVNIITNADFGNVRGIDVQLQRRFGNLFSGQVSYTYQNSKSTGSDPTDFLGGLSRAPFGVTGERPEAPQTTIRTRDDRRHNIQGTFSLSLPNDFAEGSIFGTLFKNVGAFGTFQVRSGLPYTRLINYGQGNTSGGGFGLISDLVEPLQASETPWEKYFDLRVTKGFRLGPTDWQLYADIRNLFNFVNKTTVFSETGDVYNEKFFEVQSLNPGLLSMEQDALASGAMTTITKDAGTPDERTVRAIDLTSIAATCPGWAGGGGTIACVMLQRAETRWGNGDGLYDVEEQTAAIRNQYEQGNQPARFYGGGRYIMLGMQLTF